MSERIELVEVGPRDGLQNEDVILDAARKVELIERCVAAGARRIEVASFVHPGRVPQMADAEAVVEALGPAPDGVSYIGLVLNRRGLDRALDTAVDSLNFVVGATEGFNRANSGVSIDETMQEIEEMVPEAAGAGRFTSVTVSVAFGCPYEGEVAARRVADLAGRAAAVGTDEIALGDTIGVAVPPDVARVVEAVRAQSGEMPIRLHFHDTRNTAIANAYSALEVGVGILDASVGGAGGCPFAPNATGNVATEDVLFLLDRMGIPSGIDAEATAATGRWLGEQLRKQLPSALAIAGGFPSGPSGT